MSDMKNRMMARAQRASDQSLRRLQENAAARQSGQRDTTVWVTLDQITVDERIQVRVGGLNRETVERYATIMAETGQYDPFPPVVLFREGETLWLSAGFHRVAAVMLADEQLVAAGHEPIGGVLAEVRPGGFDDAYWFAITDNLRHGLQMTSADQKEALRRLLGLDLPLPENGEFIEYASLSNRELAAIIGVTHPTIAKWRKELEQNTGGKHFPPDRAVRIGKDGKVYDVSGIQAANQRRAEDQRQSKPAAYDEPDEFDNADYAWDDEIETDESAAWLDQPAERATPPATHSVRGHSDDHDPELAAAVASDIQLRRAVYTALDSLNALLAIRGIRSLYALPKDKLALLDLDLRKLAEVAQFLPDYLAEQRERLAVMYQTRRPYDEDDETQ